MRRIIRIQIVQGLLLGVFALFLGTEFVSAADENPSESEVSKEQSEATIIHFEELAEEGDADAQFELELLKEKERENPPEGPEESIAWYWFAEEHDPADSQFNMGILYEEGPIEIRDYSNARKWYTFAAERDHAEALFRLGEIYRKGLGVLPDYVEASNFYERAGQKDHPEAKRTLINMVVLKLGEVRGDLVIPWLLQAVHEGDLEATTQLALIYDKGSGGIGQNFKEALQWYLRSAELGDPEAQERLSQMYERGEGAPRKLSSALMWLELAITHSEDKDSQNVRSLLAGLLKSQMNLSEVTEAQELKEECLANRLNNC